MPLKKLKPEEKRDTTTLIEAIERKDRRFRLFQTLFMIGTFIALIIIIGAQQRTLAGVQEQLDQAKNIAAETTKRSNEQQDTILRRLDCMSVFFSQRDRTNLSIQDIDKCTLNREGNIQEFFTQKPGEAPQTTKEQQPSSGTVEPQSAPLPRQAEPVQPLDNPPVVEPRPPLQGNSPTICVPSIFGSGTIKLRS